MSSDTLYMKSDQKRSLPVVFTSRWKPSVKRGLCVCVCVGVVISVFYLFLASQTDEELELVSEVNTAQFF